MKGLILSSGGVKGSYLVGCLQHLLGDLKTQYDVYCGISVGGINSSFLCQYERGEEYKSIRDLTYIWENLDSKNIYSSWKPFGQLSALFKPSFYSSVPLFNLISKNIDEEKLKNSSRIAYVGCTSITTGEYKIFNSKEPNFVKAIVAGASFPIMLNPIEIDGQQWVDGAIQTITPISQGIAAGCDELDIIMTSPETRDKKTIENPSIFDALRRTLNLATDQIMNHDVNNLIMYNKLVRAGLEPEKKVIKVNIIRPTYELTSNQMIFKKDEMKRMQIQGYEDAIKNYKLF